MEVIILITMTLSLMAYSTFLLILMLLIMTITAISSKNKKLLRDELIFFSVLFALLIIYFGNYDRYVWIKSTLSPQNTVILAYEPNEIELELPPNSISVSCNDYFYSKCDVKKCKDTFDASLKNLKDSGSIVNYIYDEKKKTYTITLDEKHYCEIILNSDEDNIKFSITESKWLKTN